MTLKGRWLGQFGFTTGQKLDVITQPGQLIIRLTAEE
ncbi:SymE family type I addiction module toxin [Rahnella sp. R3(2024)]